MLPDLTTIRLAALCLLPGLLGSEPRTAGKSVTFPTTTAKDLNGQVVVVPSGLSGQPLVLLAAFECEQQGEADRLMHLLKAASADFPRLNYYEIPVIQANAAVRFLINAGMRSSIKDKEARSHVIPFYTNAQAWTQQLHIPTTNEVCLLRLNEAGEIKIAQPSRSIRTRQDLLRLLQP